MRVLFPLIAIALLAVSCEKIIAEDITAETPVLILPSENDTVNQNPVHFKWEEMEGASKYHLEVVSPSFASISQFVLDSVITDTDFYFPLDSNEYELRLTALNGGYESQILGPCKFWVGVQPSGGSGNNVVLTSPADQVYVNDLFNNVFTWVPIPTASNYEFSLRQGSDFTSGAILDPQNNISQPTYTSSVTLTEGEYSWGVKAYFGSVEGPYTVHQFYVDTTDPNEAILSSPSDFSSISPGTISFIWSNGTDPGTVNAPVTSVLEISTDLAFSSPTSYDIQGNTTDIDFTTSGTYYWRVTNTDEAGNSALTSGIFEFTIL